MFSQVDVDALYVHIPFCPHKCFYCDFNSYVVESEDPVWQYLYALERELEWTAGLQPDVPLQTVFVGGGTPTALNVAQMEFFLQSLQRTFGVRLAPGAEFTMEANPGTVAADKLAVMRAGGVNRLSFGAQTFDEQLLKEIGRIHSAADVTQSVALARAAGFTNLSVDLMFGLPRQTAVMLQDSVERALALGLPHLSIYGLKIEENTLFHSLYMKNELLLPDEEVELAMYVDLMERLANAGYEQYEISNFARAGYKSRHNLTYWRNRAYYGVGAGAHGYVNGLRHVNVKGVQAYIQASREGFPRLETQVISPLEAMEDFMMVGLRVLEGVRTDDFRAQFGEPLERRFAAVLDTLCARGLLTATAGGYRLTRAGIVLGNEVFAAFLSAAMDLH